MTPYDQGYIDTLQKLAVSEGMAARALAQGYGRFMPKLQRKFPTVDWTDYMAIAQNPDVMKSLMRFSQKYPLTNLRSQGVSRLQMPQGRKDLARAERLMRQAGVDF